MSYRNYGEALAQEEAFARDEFLQHMFSEFPSVFNTSFSREMLENIVDFGIVNRTTSKNDLYYYLMDMVPELEGKELIPFINKAWLTNEVLGLFDMSEKAEEAVTRYNQIVKCDLSGISTNDCYPNSYLLTGEGIEPELEVDLTGDLCFNTEFMSLNREVVAVVNNLTELVDFCNNHDIKFSAECSEHKGYLMVGGDRDYVINHDLVALGWDEDLDLSLDDKLANATEKSAETGNNERSEVEFEKE